MQSGPAISLLLSPRLMTRSAAVFAARPAGGSLFMIMTVFNAFLLWSEITVYTQDANAEWLKLNGREIESTACESKNYSQPVGY